MKSIDIRLKAKEMQTLQALVGKKLISIYHDEFTSVNSSSQVVQINVEGRNFYLYSYTEPIDHFSEVEDVAVWLFE